MPDKPIVLFNINGFFDDVVAWIHKLVETKFASERVLDLFEVYNTLEEIDARLEKELYKTTV